ARNAGAQADLWKYSISGDLPMILVTVADTQAAGLIRELTIAHAFLKMRGLEADLIVLNLEAVGYQTPVQDQMARIVQTHTEDHGRGRVFLLSGKDISAHDRELMLGSACVVFGGHRGPLQQQLLRASDKPVTAPPAADKAAAPSPGTLVALPSRTLFNGWGG